MTARGLFVPAWFVSETPNSNELLDAGLVWGATIVGKILTTSNFPGDRG